MTALLTYMTQGQIGESAVLGAIAGTTLAYFAPEIQGVIGPGLRAASQAWAYLNRNHTGKTTHRLLDKNWWLTGEQSIPYAGEDEQASDQEVNGGTPPENASTPDAGLFQVPNASDTGGIERLTLRQICEHVERNRYKIFIGRSLTSSTHHAVQISFYKQHFRFMGASQRGKSSMVGAFLEIVTQTHDPAHVKVILLDKENLTSNLFAHLPHVYAIRRSDGSRAKLHATDNASVLVGLKDAVCIMEHRYSQMTLAQVLEQPIILVYVEEFLSLKNYFKTQAAKAKPGSQEIADYADLVYCINELAQRG
jgi:hypothetical protein